MTDCVLLSASHRNIEACIEIAVQHPGIGIELMTFAFPDLLDGNWQAQIPLYRDLLEPVRAHGGRVTLHGPFMDLPAGSPDAQISRIVADRHRHAIQIAAQVGAEIVILHANYIGQIATVDYRRGWHQRNLTFWKPIADEAAASGVTIAVENMWEFDPHIIGDMLGELDHPALRACLDVGHAHLFSRIPFAEWIRVMGPFIVHAHVNNNDGEIDVHRALNDGVLDYEPLLDALRALPQPPSFTLEMDTVEDMLDSLRYFVLPAVTGE